MHHLRSMMDQTQSTAITSVPFEILLQIFTSLPGTDVINFLSTSRYHRAFVTDETIWRELCLRYGVNDLSSFQVHPNRTFFTVYTELLHTYGPLIGLWASDSVFNGHILEFRIVTEPQDVGWEGIIGEVWQFPSTRSWDDPMPSLPDYWESLQIRLGSALDVAPQTTTEPSSGAKLLKFGCTSHRPNTYLNQPPWYTVTDPLPDSPIRRNAPHRQAYYVGFSALRNGTYTSHRSLHPTFPSLPPLGLWDNSDRRFPCLKTHHELPHRNDHRLVAELAPVLFLDHAKTPCPPSISIISPLSMIWHSRLHYPTDTLPVKILRSVPRYQDEPPLIGHYFPLRTCSKSGVESVTSDSVRAYCDLGGLWLSQNVAGSQVFYLTWDEESEEVQAWKVTGDRWVPRGALSWRFKPSSSRSVPLDDTLLNGMQLAGHDMGAIRWYEGTGTISGDGFW